MVSGYGVLDTHSSPGQYNLYRLSRESRKLLFGDESPVVSFRLPKLEHRLSIGDTLIDMMLCEFPKMALVEYKQEFTYEGKVWRYRPDLICVWLKHWLIIEVQNSSKTSNEWAKKWLWHLMFWQSGAYKDATWQPKNHVQPRIIVVSTQQESTVTYGADPRLKKIEVVRSIRDSLLTKELN